MQAVSDITKNISKVSDQITRTVDKTLENPWIMAFVKVFLILYASKLAPTSKVVDIVLSNTYIKLALIVLMIYIGNKDIQMSLLLAFILVFGITTFGNPTEKFEDLGKFVKPILPYPTEPHTMFIPGCENITMDDLILAFDNDKLALQKTLEKSFGEILIQIKDKPAKEKLMAMAYQVGLPYNVHWDDPLTPPLVATLLVNYGMILNDKCKISKI